MAITVNLYYKGANGNAKKFMGETENQVRQQQFELKKET